MNCPARFLRLILPAFLALISWDTHGQLPPGDRFMPIPEPLKAWQEWVTWDSEHRHCPTPYSDASKHLCFWPSSVALQIDRTAGRFTFSVTVFHKTWVPLPGSHDAWPHDVLVNGAPIPVVEHDGRPSVQLQAGTFRIEGGYLWNEIPQRISVPPAIGILTLAIEGKPVDSPTWDAQGILWLRRDGASEAADKDFLSVKVFALLEDGIPLWLRTDLELIVSGKSREEDLGSILPEGWKLSAVDSPLPVAVDDAGRTKVQVRAGKWTIHADAFRLDNPKELRYAAGTKPAAPEELVAFRSRPDFRMVEITGAPSIDISQVSFPEKWRDLPVYRWDTATAFQIEERMRGMGLQKPQGLSISRQWWLDENGRGLTFRDTITGEMQQVWRLDAAQGQDLGSVRSDGQGQLITRNPQSGASGVEIRTRAIKLEATGRMQRSRELSSTGWQVDAEVPGVSLNLPPGWRLFALFGADWVQGDWLTAWTLLDLFLLLIFSLAVFRLWGAPSAVLGFLAFGLSYHETGAPRFIWLVLLVPLALLRVVPEGWIRHALLALKYAVTAIFILILVPFVARQVQQALYPQLESVRTPHFAARFQGSAAPSATVNEAAWSQSESYTVGGVSIASRKPTPAKDNLMYDAKVRIQTGPGVPEWSWRTVSFGWNGPVRASQQVHPILISRTMERLITMVRVALLLALAALLFNAKRLGISVIRSRGKAVVALLLAFWASTATHAAAQIPEKATLDLLRQRLLEPSDAYPTAADIASASLTLTDRRVVVEAEIHAVIRTAVPLPGRLPTWSPLTVLLDDKPEAALRREDGFLWVVIPEGVHRVRMEGTLANVTEWEWTYQLKPRHVKIEAPGWTFTGVRPDGVPEQQVFFALQQKSSAGAASYDRQDFQTVVAIDRHLELGLLWQVRTTVTRLSPSGKAIALRVPLLPGENVLTSNAVVRDGSIEVRLGASESSYTWESGLAVTDRLRLETRAEDAWIERWHLVASPVWNVAISGLAPVFEASKPELVPVWHPWPGESVELAISRPEALAGATVTVSNASHEIALGRRQRVSKLNLSLRSTLGEDFLIDLPTDAEITSLTHNGNAAPVRRDGRQLIVPLRPGEQSVAVGWRMNTLLGNHSQAEEVGLPVESANVRTTLTMPDDRWVLWAYGPLRGPAVRFWGILICSLLAAWALGQTALSPLRAFEWMLLVIGLTQVPLPAALIVVGWLFLLAWRGRDSVLQFKPWQFNLLQLFLAGLTAVALAILIFAVGEGLLGNPEMFISGNGSSRTVLRWYQARCELLLPKPGCFSVSIWWYRFLMLAWALWLATSLLRWLGWGWRNFSSSGLFRKKEKVAPVVPPLPTRA